MTLSELCVPERMPTDEADKMPSLPLTKVLSYQAVGLLDFCIIERQDFASLAMSSLTVSGRGPPGRRIAVLPEYNQHQAHSLEVCIQI